MRTILPHQLPFLLTCNCPAGEDAKGSRLFFVREIIHNQYQIDTRVPCGGQKSERSGFLDVIIEGKITPEEPMLEVIETVVELKNYPHLVLRITSADSDVEGRIAFSHGGYILGGRINNSDDSGYKAIHQLLSVTAGNYAILDPGPQQISDINQTLWIMSERLVQYLPNLPDTPVDLFDHSAEHDQQRAQSNESLGAGAAVLSGLGYGRFEQKEVAAPVKSTINNKKGRARSFNEGFWYFLQGVCVVAFCTAIAVGFLAFFKFRTQLRTPPVKNSLERHQTGRTSATSNK